MKKIFFCTMIIVLFSGISLSAMDAQLWNAPLLPDAQIIWKDQPIEVAGIRAAGTRMHTNMAVEQVLDFYRNIFIRDGWEIKDYFKESNIVAFIKANNYMYVGVRDNGQEAGRDVYLISSPGDLAICRMVASGMDNSGVMSADTAGKDFTDLPRYPGSKRMFNISAADEANVVMYQAQGNLDQIVGFFRDNLKASGWKLVRSLDQNSAEFKKLVSPELKMENAEFTNLNFQKGNVELIVTVNSFDKSRKLNIISIIKSSVQPISFMRKGG